MSRHPSDPHYLDLWDEGWKDYEEGKEKKKERPLMYYQGWNAAEEYDRDKEEGGDKCPE